MKACVCCRRFELAIEYIDNLSPDYKVGYLIGLFGSYGVDAVLEYVKDHFPDLHTTHRIQLEEAEKTYITTF